ncbi:hypothetical protein PWT90_05361 [Aphanocladium album]|nr:hypothetical protein PWT90_05361 [Aphanocladium album]
MQGATTHGYHVATTSKPGHPKMGGDPDTATEMPIFHSLFVSLVALLPVHARVTTKTSTNPLDGATQAIEEAMDQFKVPGMSIAVVDGSDLYTKGFGYATLPNIPATEDTLWEGGSSTKAFTAAALAQMMDSNKYSSLAEGWQTTIVSILPDDFELNHPWATEHLTLQDAATHRTGMPRHDLTWIAGPDTQTPESLVRNFRNLPLSIEPRVALQYCNLMYLTLTHVIQTLTRKWYGDVLREVILEPLGMNSTYFDRNHALASGHRMATGYFWDQDEKKFQSRPRPNVRFYGGAGATISSVKDYAKWIKCLITQGKPFSPNVHNQIRTAAIVGAAEPPLGADSYGYALGWEKMSFHGTTLYRHAGTTSVFGAGVYWLPDIDYGVVMFGNTGNAANFAEYVIVWKLMEDKLGIPEDQRYPTTKPLTDILNQGAEALKHPKEILYPNMTGPVEPPSVDVRAFEGLYQNKGYGDLRLRLEPASPKTGNESLLIGHRDGFRYHINFGHASQDYWTAIPVWEESDSMLGLYAAEFILSNGKPSGMMLHLSPPGSPIDEGTIQFDKVQ